MRLFWLSACLVACGGNEPLPTQVSGTLDGVQMVLGGGGWAWAERRVPAGNGREFKPYTFHVEMTGVSFEATTPLETLELDERHRIAAAVAEAMGRRNGKKYDSASNSAECICGHTSELARPAPSQQCQTSPGRSHPR